MINTKEQTIMNSIKGIRKRTCVFIRINPDEEDFNIFKEINKIHRHVKKSFKKLLIDKILKNLLELKFKSNHLIITKTLKRVVKKTFYQITKNGKYTIKS